MLENMDSMFEDMINRSNWQKIKKMFANCDCSFTTIPLNLGYGTTFEIEQFTFNNLLAAVRSKESWSWSMKLVVHFMIGPPPLGICINVRLPDGYERIVDDNILLRQHGIIVFHPYASLKSFACIRMDLNQDFTVDDICKQVATAQQRVAAIFGIDLNDMTFNMK